MAGRSNGSVTKDLLKAAKSRTGEDLRNAAIRLMGSFPLSSNHLLYDQDKNKVDPEAWKILVEAAIETDARKLVRQNQLLAEAGLKLDRTYGRFTKRRD